MSEPNSVDSSDINDLFEIVGTDVDEAEVLLADADTQPRRRGYIRAVFAAVEGTTYLLKHGVLADVDGTFSIGEVAMLREEAFDVGADGRIRMSAKFIPTASNIRFAFAMQAKNNLQNLPIDFGDAGWECLQTAIGIRNRLMHPKHPAYMVVSDSELTLVRKGYQWFTRSVIALLYYVNESLREKGERLEAQASEFRPGGSAEPPVEAT